MISKQNNNVNLDFNLGEPLYSNKILKLKEIRVAALIT